MNGSPGTGPIKGKAKLVIVTQDSPFFLAESLDRFLTGVEPYASVEACVVLDVSPFGKPTSLLHQALDTLRVFGPRFFFRYTARYLRAKLSRRTDVSSVLHRHGVVRLELSNGINHPDSLAAFAAYEPDLIVSIASSQIFRRPLLDLPRIGCLNVHTALLPKYRGLMPTFWVLRNDEEKTGVSVFFMDEGIDSGPIVVQKELPIGDRSQDELISATKQLGADALVEAVRDIVQGTVALKPNDDDQMTYFSKPTRQDVRDFYRAGKRFF